MKNRPAIISILGMPGAGKTTLGKYLARLFVVEHVTAGDVARTLANKDKETFVCLQRGEIAPPVKMNAQMLETLQRYVENDTTVIVDGYPRYLDQYNDLMALSAGRADLYFIALECHAHVAYDRLLSRGRSDDSAEVIEKRCRYFIDETYKLYGQIAVQYRDHSLFHWTGTQVDDLIAAGSFLRDHNIK